MQISIGLPLKGGGKAGVAAPPPFTPTDISGLQAWYKADGTKWQDTGRTVTATQDADPVGCWDDLSSLSGHATQGTAGKRPTLKLNQQNGLPCIRFDGTDDALLLPLALQGAKTIAVVYKLTATPGASAFYSLLSAKYDATKFTELLLMNLAGYSPTTWKHDFASGTSVGIATALGTTTRLVLHTYNAGTNDATGSYTARVNGAAATLQVSGALGRTGTDVGSVGGRVSSGGVGANLLNGDIHELIVYDSVLSGTDQTSLETYMNGRWGVY